MDDTQLTQSVERLEHLVDLLEEHEKPKSKLKDFQFDLGTHSFYDVLVKDHITELLRIAGTFFTGYTLARGINFVSILLLCGQQLPVIVIAYGIFHTLVSSERIAKALGFVIESVDEQL